jgi:hypothetical protein
MPTFSWPHGWTAQRYEFDHSVNKPHNFTLSEEQRPFGEDAASHRFEVQSGDVSDMDTAEARKDGVARARSEIAQVEGLQGEGDEYWYAWSFYVPDGFPDSVAPPKEAWPYVTLTQFMQSPREFEERWDPAFVFAKHREDGFILQRFPARGRKGSTRWKLISNQDFAGRWHELVVHIKWTCKDDGFIRVWVDGASQPTVDQTLATREAVAGVIYHKYGIYRIDAAGDGPGIVFFSRLRRGRTRSDVEPWHQGV